MTDSNQTNEMPVEPYAWRFEAASRYNKETGEYTGWKWQISDREPNMGKGMRNVTPLYPADALPAVSPLQSGAGEVAQNAEGLLRQLYDDTGVPQMVVEQIKELAALASARTKLAGVVKPLEWIDKGMGPTARSGTYQFNVYLNGRGGVWTMNCIGFNKPSLEFGSEEEAKQAAQDLWDDFIYSNLDIQPAPAMEAKAASAAIEAAAQHLEHALDGEGDHPTVHAMRQIFQEQADKIRSLDVAIPEVTAVEAKAAAIEAAKEIFATGTYGFLNEPLCCSGFDAAGQVGCGCHGATVREELVARIDFLHDEDTRAVLTSLQQQDIQNAAEWLRPQRNDVPMTGEEAANALINVYAENLRNAFESYDEAADEDDIATPVGMSI